MQEAIDAKIYDPNACSLATVDSDGRPSARAVLLKGLEDGRFVFYSNYNSRKASHLLANPHVSMHFPWFPMQRQVTVLGDVARVKDSLAEEYFHSRPYLSQIGAWASDQSKPLDSRETLEKSFLAAKEKFGENPPKPPHWGGYYLDPRSIEFWQGGPNRLHDRFIRTSGRTMENHPTEPVKKPFPDEFEGRTWTICCPSEANRLQTGKRNASTCGKNGGCRAGR